MTVNDAVEFFKTQHIRKFQRKLQTIKDVGLGYVTLGQIQLRHFLVEKLNV